MHSPSGNREDPCAVVAKNIAIQSEFATFIVDLAKLTDAKDLTADDNGTFPYNTVSHMSTAT